MPLPRVSSIPGIYKQDLSGFESWICKGLHTKEEKCCVNARNSYYNSAADLGTDIHSLREAFLRGESFADGVPEYQAKLFDPVAKFYKETEYKPICIEEQMNGKDFTGKLDGCGTFGQPFWEGQRKTFWADANMSAKPKISDIWVDDLKVKSKIDVLHPVQLYGYRELLKETKGIEANWGLIIRRNKDINKRPEIQLKGYFLPDYKSQWESSLKMWRFLNA